MKRPVREVLLMALMLPLLPACGNKGDLTLTADSRVDEGIVILEQPVPESAQPDDEEKPDKKSGK